MTDAHDEAVEAMAWAIMRPDVRAHYEAHPDPEVLAYYRERATDALAALVRSEAVRAALMEAEGRQPCVVNPYEGSERSGDPGFVYCCGLAHPACVLAALAAAEAT